MPDEAQSEDVSVYQETHAPLRTNSQSEYVCVLGLICSLALKNSLQFVLELICATTC